MHLILGMRSLAAVNFPGHHMLQMFCTDTILMLYTCLPMHQASEACAGATMLLPRRGLCWLLLA
jgi:hypothetical protein